MENGGENTDIRYDEQSLKSHRSRVKDPLVRMSASWLEGIDIFHLGHWVRIDPVEQPIKCHSVGVGCVSHWRASAFDDHLDHRFIVLKRCTRKRFGGTVSRPENHDQILPKFTPPSCDTSFVSTFFDHFSHVSCLKLPWAESFKRGEFPRTDECNTPVTKSHRSYAGIPSICKTASKEIPCVHFSRFSLG